MNIKSYNTIDVFTPTTPAKLNYVEREDVESKLNDALSTPGKQIVVYGHSGSGKSSLVRKSLKQFYQDEIILSCTSETTINEIIINSFDYLNKYYCPKVKNKNVVKISSELKAIYSNIKSEMTSEESISKSRIVPVQLTPQRLAEFIGDSKCCLVLEDFHKVSEKEKKKLSQIMKVFMDASADYSTTKIIAIGAVDSAREIVQLEPEMRNRISEIHVPLMTDDELFKIIDNGCKYLNIGIFHNVIDAIIDYSSGLASFCHQICLNMCRNKNINSTSKKEIQFLSNDFFDSIKMIVENTQDSLKAKLDKAFKNTRSCNFDNIPLILHALVSIKSDEVTRSVILKKIQEKEETYPSGNLTTYLNQLTTEKRGKILKLDKNSNKYSFSDPIFRANIMFRFTESDIYSRREPKKLIDKLDDEDIFATLNAIKDIEREANDDEF